MSWVTTSNLNEARYYLAGCGTTLAALSFGGYSPHLATTEKWSGPSWVKKHSL